MRGSQPKIITTSWDDGHPADRKLADLLVKYQIKATFYIPRTNPERDVLPENEIKELSTEFEIGGHTLNHVLLDRLDASAANDEILGCQKWLSDILGLPARSFCYPAGRFTTVNVGSVKAANFAYARTVQLLRTDVLGAYHAPTTLQMYKHRMSSYLKNSLKRSNFSGLRVLLFDFRGTTDLVEMTRLFLEKIENEGGVFHLWGHSWEIDNNNSWKELDMILSLLSKRSDFRYVTNGELSTLIPSTM